jgi:AcrR family transcriptional regulator
VYRDRCIDSRRLYQIGHIVYFSEVPRLWTNTIDAHRREVRDAILATTVALVAEHGPRAVTMSGIAERTGIGRATLYKYFRDVEAILAAWHERHVAGHLDRLTALARGTGDAGERLAAVLEGVALIQVKRHAGALAPLLHREEHVGWAQRQVGELLRGPLAEAADAGVVRADVPPAELVSYCLHALAAARELSSEAAVRRLVAMTMSGMREPAAAR